MGLLRGTIRLRHRTDRRAYAEVSVTVRLRRDGEYHVRWAVDPAAPGFSPPSVATGSVGMPAWEAACLSGAHYATRTLGLRPHRNVPPGGLDVDVVDVRGRLPAVVMPGPDGSPVHATVVLANAAALAVAAAVRRTLAAEPPVNALFEVVRADR